MINYSRTCERCGNEYNPAVKTFKEHEYSFCGTRGDETSYPMQIHTLQPGQKELSFDLCWDCVIELEKIIAVFVWGKTVDD